MWMGGIPPLGYRAQDGKLLVVESEAEIVRAIFTAMPHSARSGY